MSTYSLPVRASLLMLLAGSPSLAQHQHDTHGVDLDGTQEAHVHGVAELLVVLEGGQLDIEFRSPAINLLGFEHHANNPEQQAKVESVRKTLADADSLFQFDPPLCHIADHTANFSSVVEAPGHRGDKNETDDHDTHHKAHGHSDIDARYRYQCERPDQLRSLLANIPAQFPGIQSLQVEWIAGGRQGAATLDNSQRHIIFR